MARCTDCNKFVSLELGDNPDMNIDIDEEGVITGDVTITRNCAECGTEMKEGKFDVNVTIDEEVRHSDVVARSAPRHLHTLLYRSVMKNKFYWRYEPGIYRCTDFEYRTKGYAQRSGSRWVGVVYGASGPFEDGTKTVNTLREAKAFVEDGVARGLQKGKS